MVFVGSCIHSNCLGEHFGYCDLNQLDCVNWFGSNWVWSEVIYVRVFLLWKLEMLRYCLQFYWLKRENVYMLHFAINKWFGLVGNGYRGHWEAFICHHYLVVVVVMQLTILALSF